MSMGTPRVVRAILNGRTFTSLAHHRNYRLYFSGQFLSQVGTWLQSAAMAWLVLQLTHSAFAVGLLAFWQFGPYALLGLFGGAIADRLDHRKTLVATQVALAVCSATMAGLTLTHVETVWECYAIAAMRGTVLILNNPSRQAFIFQMVGRDELPNAIALNSSLANATRILGPGLGGILIAAFGVGICFSIDAISYGAVIVSLLAMRTGELLPMERKGRPSVLAGTLEGLSYARRSPTIWVALAMFVMICTASINFSVLLPVVASNTLRAGAEVYGLLTAVFGAGAFIGALISASIGRAAWRILLVSAAAFGLGELVLAPQRSVAGAAILLLLTGVAYTLYTSNTNALVQLAAPSRLQGRIAGLYSYIFSASSPLGALLMGALAESGGTQAAFLVGGAVAVGSAGFGLLMKPRGPAAPPSGEKPHTLPRDDRDAPTGMGTTTPEKVEAPS